jgi:hypothetical protein
MLPVLWDEGRAVYDQWRDGPGQPQYIVLDRELQEVDRGEGVTGHEAMTELAASLLHP